MPESIIECVPNFSEGRDSKILAEIVGSIEAAGGVKVLDVDSGLLSDHQMLWKKQHFKL